MSFAILPTSIFADHNLAPSELRVLGSLYSFRSSSSDWITWPSRESIAKRCGITHVDSISRITRRLVKKGYLAITRRQTSNLYRLTLPTPPDLTTSGQIRPDTPLSDNQIIDQTRKKDPLTPLQGDVVIVDIAKPEPVAEPESVANQDQDITEDQAAFVIALFNQLTGARLDATARPLKRLVDRRLRTYTPAQLQVAISFYASLWANTPLAHHARNPRCVLSPTRIEFALSETARKSGAGAGASSRLWKPDPPKPKAETGIVRQALGEMMRMLKKARNRRSTGQGADQQLARAKAKGLIIPWS